MKNPIRSPLRRRRQDLDLSMDEIYLRSAGRITQDRLSRIERGIYVARPDERAALSDILGVPEAELFPPDVEDVPS